MDINIDWIKDQIKKWIRENKKPFLKMIDYNQDLIKIGGGTILAIGVIMIVILSVFGGSAGTTPPVPTMAPTTHPTPTTTISNSSPAIPSVSPIINASPAPTAVPSQGDLKDYYIWKNETDNGTIPLVQTDVNPLGQNGSQPGVYQEPCPTPTVAPTATPLPWNYYEVHQVRDDPLPDLQVDSEVNGYLTFDNLGGNATGLFPYYTPGDVAVFNLTFLNTNSETVVDPDVNIEIFETSLTQTPIQVYDKAIAVPTTIPAVSWNYDHTLCYPGQWNFVYPIPGSGETPIVIQNFPGTYIIQFNVTSSDGSPLDWISREVTILPIEATVSP